MEGICGLSPGNMLLGPLYRSLHVVHMKPTQRVSERVQTHSRRAQSALRCMFNAQLVFAYARVSETFDTLREDGTPSKVGLAW
jgi:hypothetical protein